MDIVKILLNNDADINSKNEYGNCLIEGLKLFSSTKVKVLLFFSHYFFNWLLRTLLRFGNISKLTEIQHEKILRKLKRWNNIVFFEFFQVNFKQIGEDKRNNI